MKEVILVLFFSLSSVVYANTYYVATSGKDSNPGTKALPWMTWQKAFDTAKAGDTVYFRGGTWYPTSHGVGNTVVQHSPRTVAGVYEGVTHGYNGTIGNPVCFFNYPGEVPILDCSRVDMAGHRFNTGLGFTLSQYIHTKGLTIRNVYQPISGELACGVGADACAHMIFTEMDVYNIGGRGMTYWGANGYFGINNDSVHYYNCDIHDCYDPLSQEPGNGADGWKGGNEPGGYFYFEGCRAWNCSDDGFDVSGNSYAKFDKCWSFGHGWKGMGLDGNGFKFGAISDSFPSPMRVITRCLAAFNHGSGYYDLEYANYYRNNSRVYNNTSFKNGYGFTNSTNAPKPWCLSVYKNNVSYKSTELTPDGRPYNAALLDATYPESNNTWKLNDPRPGSWPWFLEAISVTDADFISVDSTGISGPRKADGSLPDINFLRLSSTSKLKDAGIDVGLPFYGSAPDLGYSEDIEGTPIIPIPRYLSSVIASSTPSRLEITYSISLANIVPATSAFSVMVNSSTRSISSVTVSGEKVQLTLGSPVKYGDVVTVTYNKPATNPLQTAAGGQAASFSAQNVTNNVASAASPVYVSSVVENATPSRLEITYSLSLANIVPAISAFTVMVNSSARSISSVSVSGEKVQLTLGSPVKYSDVVTVAYNKPATNPLQTAAGGQAASISDKTVINNIGSTNTPPVIVVSYRSSSYSGFVNEINASGSYDSNKDNLTYTWIVPTGIDISTTTGSIIKYLGPVVSSSQRIEFTLSVNDGKTTESRIIPIEILPYKPELEVAEVSNIEASSYQAAYYPYNIIDGNIGTMWSANGGDQWLIVELKHPFTIQHIKLAFQPGQKMESYFDILGSKDKVVWEPILIKSASCSFSGDLQVFEFPPSKTGKEFSYIKLIGQGNMNDSWNYISELKIFGFRQRNSLAFEQLPVKIYPNPAKEIVTIRIDESTLMPDLIKLIDLSGVVCLEEQVDPDIREFKIPINLKNGIYILQLCSGRMTLFAQKLVVSK